MKEIAANRRLLVLAAILVAVALLAAPLAVPARVGAV
jgi:hypothetical protein